jgi:heavy metal translocating P-type ATPase
MTDKYTPIIKNLDFVVAVFALIGLSSALISKFLFPAYEANILFFFLIAGALPLVYELSKRIIKFEFGSDILAIIAIITAALLGEYYAGLIVVLMLSGGEALEAYASQKASFALQALAKRMPAIAHKATDSGFTDVHIDTVQIGDTLVILPFETSPVDGEVVEGHSQMDESFLTGEPFHLQKAPGAAVISGSVNGEGVLKIIALKPAADSRFAKILEVMRRAETERPRIRRLADRLGAIYTPLALIVAGLAWYFSGESARFLSVLVIATPCPLLISIPTAIISSISLCAKYGIIIKNPSVMEQINSCKTIILDKTGTLTYGVPELTKIETFCDLDENKLLQFAASLEQFSRHPLSQAVITEADKHGLPRLQVSEVSEKQGEGLSGFVAANKVKITSRKKLEQAGHKLPELASEGMEFWILISDQKLGRFVFRDSPRKEGPSFIQHLGPKHDVERVMIVSGDKESEVRYLAEKVGIKEVYASQSPEQKVEHVRRESLKAKVLFVGDGINDAPALQLAHVGIAFGQASDVTTEAAGAVILDSSLLKLDQLFHISDHMMKIAKQSAIGGMSLSVAGMILAAFGYLPPIYGAVGQELIDLLAVLNALRAAWPPKYISDMD